VLPNGDRRELFVLHGHDAVRAARARVAAHRSGQGSTKKRREGGAEPTGGAGYSALIPDDEWEYVVTDLAETFGQDWWDTYWSRPHGQPHLTWYTFYQLDEKRRIDALRRELSELDRAQMTAYAVNKPDELDRRRKDLLARVRRDPTTPAQPKFTQQEMNDAVQRLMAKNWKSSNKIPS